MTIETLYRWLGMLDDGPEVGFQIWRTKIERYDVFIYTAIREGSPLPRLSAELLTPGDYGAYYYLKEESKGVL